MLPLEKLFNGASLTPSLLWVPVQLEIVVLLREEFPNPEGSQEASQPRLCVLTFRPRWRPNTSKLFGDLGTQTKHLIWSAKDAASTKHSTQAVIAAPLNMFFSNLDLPLSVDGLWG